MVVDDECMRALLPKLRHCASGLEAALASGTPVRVRFHDDCDGICSALALLDALEKKRVELHLPSDERGVPLVSSSQAGGAIYEKKDAFEDLKAMQVFAPKKPVFVFLDFAANAESVEGLKALKDAGARILIIDHHPPSQDALALGDCFVSSHEFDNTGGHSAGLVATQFARLLDPGVPESYAWCALQSDKSHLAKEGELKEAVAIDYLAHHSEKGVSADYYAEKLADGPAIELAWKLAKRSEQKVLEVVSKHLTVRGCECDLKFVLVDLEKLVKKGSYPSKGKALNLAHAMEGEKLEKPVVSFGYSKDGVSVRANDYAIDAGFRASLVIQELKKEFGDAITSGGGHDAAASIRFKAGFQKQILSRFEGLACKQFQGRVAKHGPCKCGATKS